MRIHNKSVVKLFSILVGATFGSILYSVQSRNSYSHRTDRHERLDAAHQHAVDLEAGQEFSFIGKKQSSAENDEDPTPARPGSFVTMAPNDPELKFRVSNDYQPSTCAPSLQYQLLKFPWSAQYYHPPIQTIMSSANMNEQEYHRLENYSMPFGFHYRDRLEFEELKGLLDLFSTKESIFDFTPDRKHPCLTCAVIGNGGILNGSGMGKEIDDHDMVFRVNHCIRRGHELDVGTRTTHYVFMDRSLMHTKLEDVPNDKGIKWVFLPCRKNDYVYIADVAKGSKRQKLKAKAEDIRILHPDFVRYVHKVWMRTKSFRPSTGAMMLFTALHAGCDKLSVYGMGFNKDYTEHYYDNKFIVYRDVRGSHDFPREIEIMKELDKAGIIKWYKRDVPKFIS